MYLPKRIIQYYVSLLHIHHRFQQRLFACCTQELCDGSQLSAISRCGVISPVQSGADFIFFGLCIQREVHGPILFQTGQTNLRTDMVRRILTQNHARLDKVILVLQTGEVTFYAQSLQSIIKVSFHRRMCIYSQRNIKYRR